MKGIKTYKQLVYFLKKQGISVYRLCKEAEINPSTVTRGIYYERELKSDMLKKIEAAIKTIKKRGV